MRALLTSLLLLAPIPALAYGPGVHVREAARTLELLAAQDAEWAAAAALPEAAIWLRAGSISPDFQWITGKLGFGHSKPLSYHLLEVADTPERRLFALGHLAHLCSDASSEVFLGPTLFASQPLGMFDLFADADDAKGETEGICEGVGDFVFGDWDAVVDLLYDVYLGGPDSEELFVAIFDWYCVEGSAFSGKPDQCAGARAEVAAKLDQGKQLLGGFDREGAKSFLHAIIDAPLGDLLDVVGGGFASALLGSQAAKSVHFDEEMARAKKSALADPAFWGLYEESFVDLGPLLTLDHLETGYVGWPDWEPKGFVSGNLQSMLLFLPGAYAWGHGLLVDDVSWWGQDGAPVAEVTADLAGQEMTAHVRLFTGLPIAGTVHAVVRKDLPGFTTSGPVVGEASVDVDLDPALFTTTKRPVVDIPFTADTDGALGFILELRLDDEQRPWFTTSLDRVWTIPSLPLHWPVYTANFGTYGHWPPSLPVTLAPTTPGALMVRAHQHPDGPPLAGALITVKETQAGAVAAQNGVAWFDTLPPGTYTVDATGAGLLSRGPAEATVEPRGLTWAHVALERVPQVTMEPATWTAAPCLPFTWDVAAFEGLATGFEARGIDTWSKDEVTPPAAVDGAGDGELCVPEVADGVRVAVGLRALYPDGPGIAEGVGVAVGIDRSPPVISEGLAVVPVDPNGCLEAWEATPALVPVTLTVTYEEPHSGTSSFQVALGDGPFMDLPLPRPRIHVPAVAHLDPAALGATPADATVRVRIVNLAGLEVTSEPAALPVWGEEKRCPTPPGPDAGTIDAGSDAGAEDTGVEADTAAPDAGSPDTGSEDVAPAAPADDGGDDGCAATPGAVAGPLAWLLVALWALRRREDA